MSAEYYIKELREMAKKCDKRTSIIAEEVLGLPEFATWSACQHNTGHHFGTGGLARHTYEVASLCETNALQSFKFEDYKCNTNYKIDLKVLYLAALFHDIGKVWDYELKSAKKTTSVSDNLATVEEEEWVGTDHRRKIHHISRSAIFWSKSVEKTGLCEDIEDEVLHCILSHHGRREWGSPVAPLSREAWILHLSDCLSARMNDCDRVDLVKTTKQP